jgi:hypothetical protein
MPKWNWLEKPENNPSWSFIFRVIAKAVILFVVLNVLFALIVPMDALGRVSLYNNVLPGRERLPYGDSPSLSYNVSLFNIPAMFASHEVSGGKVDDEFRVFLIGDSATWGWLLENGDTLAGIINAQNPTTDDGGRIVVYNLAYPSMTLTKDLLLLDYAMRYQPDLIIWPMTLKSFPHTTQFADSSVQDKTLVLNNTERVRDLIETYNLDLDPNDGRFVEADFMDNTIVGQRRNLADLLRLQFYGFSWASTEIDQYMKGYELRQSDFDEDTIYMGFSKDEPFTEDDLAFDVLAAGIEIAGDVPVLIINEPIFITDGMNHELHYNSFYPCWAYDLYSDMLTEQAENNNWIFLDLGDALPPDVFTDTPVHFTPDGAGQYTELVLEAIADILQNK